MSDAEKLDRLRKLAAECRRAQKHYFRTSRPSDLVIAKDRERRLDEFLEEIHPDDTPKALLSG